jgi:hypothetical protein
MVNSAMIQKNIMNLLSDRKQHSVQEIKSYLAEINIGAYSEGQFSGSMNTLQRNGKINKIRRGVYVIRRDEGGNDIMKTCFIVSPIGDNGSETRDNADKLFRHILKPVCKNCGFEAKRVDQLNEPNSITQTILENLEGADLVIADISSHNPNVFYEIGFRTRTNKPIIHLKAQGEDLPFDIYNIRTFEYNLADLDSVEEVKGRLERTIEAINFPSDEPMDSSDAVQENVTASLFPILYKIIDEIANLQNEVKRNNNGVIQSVISAMQNSQPQVLPEAALQTQLVNAFIQNPENLMRLTEIADKFPSQQSGKKPTP